MNELTVLIKDLLFQHATVTTTVVGGTIVALLGLVLARMLSSGSAAQRHLVLASTLIGMAALGAIQVVGPKLTLEILPAQPPAASVIQPWAPSGANNASIAATELRSGIASPETAPLSSEAPNLVLLVYLSGVLLMLAPLLAGSLRMQWIVRRARTVTPDEIIGRMPSMPEISPVRILLSESIRVPLAWGWREAALLLPEEAVDWPLEMRRDAIVHELAHLERRDLLFQTIGRMSLALHWFNPFAWIVFRRMVLEAEQACDDRVLEAGSGTADYAERLLRIASAANHRSLRRLSAVAMARSSQLATRIEALLESSRARSGRLGRVRVVATLVSLLIPALVLGAVQVERRDAPEAERKSERALRSDSSTRAPRTWNSESHADQSPLYAAIRFGNVEMVEAILDAGADPNSLWYGDGTPLIIAVRRGERAITELLLDRGARPDLGIEGDGNALIVAADQGDLWSLRRFIEAGADVDASVEGDGNPLIAAARQGQVDALEILVDHGADIEKVVPGDENALISAAGAGELRAVRYLVSAGADVNATVLVHSWKTGQIEMRSPLSMARERGHEEVVAYLRSVGASE